MRDKTRQKDGPCNERKAGTRLPTKLTPCLIKTTAKKINRTTPVNIHRWTVRGVDRSRSVRYLEQQRMSIRYLSMDYLDIAFNESRSLRLDDMSPMVRCPIRSDFAKRESLIDMICANPFPRKNAVPSQHRPNRTPIAISSLALRRDIYHESCNSVR